MPVSDSTVTQPKQSIHRYDNITRRSPGFKNLVREGSSGITFDFYIYDGKGDNCVNEKHEHLSKSSQVVANQCVDLPVMSNINCFLTTGFHHMICYYIWKQKRFLMLEQHVPIGYKVAPCKSWSLGNELLMWYKFRTRRKMSWQQCSANSIMCCLYWAISITSVSVQKGQDKKADSFRIQ